MQNQHPLLGNVTTTVDGDWNNMRGVGDGTTLFNAWLSAAGGSATVTIETRMRGGPAKTQFTFTLSGASDHAEAILDKENWYEARARVTAISSAVVTAVMGV